MRRSLRFFVALTISLPVALVCVLHYPGSETSVLSLLVLFASSPLWIRFGKSLWRWLTRQDIFCPLIAFPLAYIAWFAIGSINFVEVRTSIDLGAFEPIPSKILVYAGIGLAGYLCGARSSLLTSREWRRNSVPPVQWTWEPKSFRVAVLALAFVMLGTYLCITAQTGIPILGSEPAQQRLVVAEYHWLGTPFFASAFTVLFLLLSRLWMGTGRLAAATRRLSIGGALLVLLAFLSFGGRAPFFGAILTALVLYHYLKKPLQFGKLTIIAVILFAWLSVYGYLRDLTLGNSTDWLESVGLSGPMQPFAYCYLYIRQSVATFRDVVQVIPSQVPYQYGAITTLPFQSVLPGHHQMSDWFFRNLLGNEFVGQGQPASILGPFYADFGPVGIFVGMFAWGLLMSKLYRWMLKDRRLIPTMIFAWTTQAGLFGLFGGVFGYLDALMIPLCWVLLDFLIRPLAHRTKLPHRVQGIA